MNYQVLDLPAVPDQFLTSIDKYLGELQLDNEVYNKQYVVTKDDCVVPPARYLRYEITGELVEWIKNNIKQDFYSAGYSITNTNPNHLPHVDAIGTYKINYILDTGGDNVVTNFYQTPEGAKPGFRPSKFEDLTLIDSVVFQPNTWYMLNTQVIHGVENIITPRKQLTITCF